MNRVVNYLRGTARVRITGLFPERVINLYARNGVEFWAVAWSDETTVRITVREQGIGNARMFAEKAQCQFAIEETQGVPGMLRVVRRRYGFLIGMIAAMLSAVLLSVFVMTV